MRLYQKSSIWRLLSPVEMARSLFKHRRLLWKFARRNVELQHKGTFLGATWTFLQPILLFGVYAFVFLAVFNSRFGIIEGETRVDYAIGLFLGLLLVQVMQEALTASPHLILSNPNFVKKVVFPLEILPVALVLAGAFRCAVGLLLVFAATLIWGPGISVHALWLVPLFISLILVSLGCAWAFAAIGVFIRDVAPMVQLLSVLLMFASAVFYSFKSIPPAFGFLRYNPLLVIVEQSRGALLWNLPPSGPMLAYALVVSGGCCLLGYAIFSGLKEAFADVI
jgi:lipopolysaccharide transport system permease protein